MTVVHRTACDDDERQQRQHTHTRHASPPAPPFQSLCAVAHLDFNLIGIHSYDQLFQTVVAAARSPRHPRAGLDALQQTYRRMVFNVAGANHDDHTKNFGFLATPDGTWSLSSSARPSTSPMPTGGADSEWTSRHLCP